MSTCDIHYLAMAAVDNKLNECAFAKAKEKVQATFGVSAIKEFQEKAIRSLLLRKDVLVVQATGSGKSLIFQSFPGFFDVYSKSNPHPDNSPGSICLVISPLSSLMQDQVLYLNSVGVNSAFIGDEQTDESVKMKVENGYYNLVYGSPEAFLACSRWQKMLTGNIYRNRVCLIAVDEAHCICHWGYSLKKGEIAFRKWFSRINEIRSLLKAVPVLALTATATMVTRKKIVQALEMNNPLIISHSPNRPNIPYAVHPISGGANETFSNIIQNIKQMKIGFERLIIYCQTIKIVAHVYGVFKEGLGADMYYCDGDATSALVEMYHSRIDELNRENIIKDFSNKNGIVRVLIATIAYGMGINCQGVKSIVHYGPSRNIEAYLQESGRAGRDSSDLCTAVVLYSNVMLKHSDDPVKDYVNNTTICRRVTLLKHFETDLKCLEKPSKPHECCDVCQRTCHCSGDGCDFTYFQSKSSDVGIHVNQKQRQVTLVQKEKLKDKLEYIQMYLANRVSHYVSYCKAVLFTPHEFVCGFGPVQIQQVLDNIEKVFTTSDLHKFVDIWEQQVATEIIVAIQQVFGDTVYPDNLGPTDDEDDLFSFWSWGDDQDDELIANIPAEFIQLAKDTSCEEWQTEM